MSSLPVWPGTSRGHPGPHDRRSVFPQGFAPVCPDAQLLGQDLHVGRRPQARPAPSLKRVSSAPCPHPATVHHAPVPPPQHHVRIVPCYCRASCSFTCLSLLSAAGTIEKTPQSSLRGLQHRSSSWSLRDGAGGVICVDGASGVESA